MKLCKKFQPLNGLDKLHCERLAAVRVHETKTGLRIDIKPNDRSKKKAFKEALEKYKDFYERKRSL